MDVSLFDFDLPEDRIALRPVSPRDQAKLLHIEQGQFSHHQVCDLPNLLREGDILVLNETKVLPAALRGVRAKRPVGGGRDVHLDLNLLSRIEAGIWDAFARPAKRLKLGDRITFSPSFYASVKEKIDGKVRLEFNCSGDVLMRALDGVGMPPLPPYIARKRAVDARDKPDYQTVFAREKGSVAAPTAGLHFTPDLLSRLDEKGIKIAKITLHVGAGTFLPVSSENTDDHAMHSEWFEISEPAAKAINAVKRSGGRVIGVGTTALRALESASDEHGDLKPCAMDTNIFITLGYEFKIIDGLMTNFHLPKSTLFMLVSALAGLDTMQIAYENAIKNGYRFYSYGDSSLIWKI